MSSDKEFHHLSEDTAQHMDEELYQLIHSNDNGNRHKNHKERKDSRNEQEQRSRQPFEGAENQIYHLTTHPQNHTHQAEQEDRAEHEINQQLNCKRESGEHATAKLEKVTDIRKQKQKVSNQSHMSPSNAAPLSK
jgi:hypothetical protein